VAVAGASLLRAWLANDLAKPVALYLRSTLLSRKTEGPGPMTSWQPTTSRCQLPFHRMSGERR
jgi:hypothetical protein